MACEENAHELIELDTVKTLSAEAWDPGEAPHLPVPLSDGTEQRRDPPPVDLLHHRALLQQEIAHFHLPAARRRRQGCGREADKQWCEWRVGGGKGDSFTDWVEVKVLMLALLRKTEAVNGE